MTDNRPILLATDGSPSAENAQRKAIELAQVLGVRLVVVSVAHLTLPTVGYGGYGYSDVVAELTEAEHKRVEKLLETVADAADAAGVSCTTFALDGFAVDEICQKAVDQDVQLIIVGSHGWGAARRFFSGSVSTGLVHSALCPVLVVPSPHEAYERAKAA